MHIYGLIYKVNISQKLIALKKNNRLYFFYFQNSLMKLFRKYLYEGNYISLVYDDDSMDFHDGIYAYKVLYLNKIFVPGKYRPDIFYDKDLINKSLANMLENLDNILFIDLEMTMPDYNSKNHDFVSEIIQAGFFVINENKELVEEYNYYIRPTKNRQISTRTKQFLSLNNNDVKNAVSYYRFYNKFKALLNKYHPAIIVWGKNDIICLDNSYIINKLPSLKFLCRFIDLNKLIKNYYELKHDPGLFKMQDYYLHTKNLEQSHNALEDARVTYRVFEEFKKDVKNAKNFLEEEKSE